MTTHRTQQDSHDTGLSRFAKRGQSHEERMPDDDSAEKFAGASKATEHGSAYGSGGSYGYGGAFEHGGERGYQVSFAERRPVNGGEERYEATGTFGRDAEGYSREGIGHPGSDEKRPAGEVTDGAPASGHPAVEDARKGYSQESGYVQSGGNPAPGGHKADKKKVSRKTN
jgi:hypothetical protein